jgi:hypothetical protein
MAVSRGYINNNPGNIRHNGDTFQGEVTSRDRAFKQFSHIRHGYRAMFVTLGTYLDRGKNTIEKIIRSWAPPSENNTESYIATVEKRSGVNRSKILTGSSGEDFIKIVAAMSFVENGVAPVMDDVIAGFNLQTKISR